MGVCSQNRTTKKPHRRGGFGHGVSGGGLPGNSPDKTSGQVAGDPRRPAFAAPVCKVFPVTLRFSVFEKTPWPFPEAISNSLKCYF